MRRARDPPSTVRIANSLSRCINRARNRLLTFAHADQQQEAGSSDQNKTRRFCVSEQIIAKRQHFERDRGPKGRGWQTRLDNRQFGSCLFRSYTRLQPANHVKDDGSNLVLQLSGLIFS